MRQVNWLKVATKTVLVLAIIVVAVPVFVISAVGLMLRTGLAGELLCNTIEKCVDADVAFESIKGSVLHLPVLTLELDDLLVTYPHERFDSLYTVASAFDPEGRGEVKDTLLSLGSLDVGVNLLSLMKGTVNVPFAEMHDIRVYVHQYDSLHSNWDILKTKRPKDSTEKKSGFVPEIILDNVHFGDMASRLVFHSHPKHLAFAADLSQLSVGKREKFMDLSLDATLFSDCGARGIFSAPLVINGGIAAEKKFGSFHLDVEKLKADIIGMPFEADGKFVFRKGIIAVDASAGIPDFHMGDFLCENRQYMPVLASKLSTDLVMSVGLNASGAYSAEDKLYPSVSLRVGVPKSKVSYAGFVSGAGIDMDLSGHLSPNGTFDARVLGLKLSGSGINISASGDAEDILGKDLKLSLDLDSKIDVASLLSFVMQDSTVFKADGKLSVSFDAKDITRAQMQIPGFTDADLRAEVDGDVLNVWTPGQDLTFHMDHPHIVIRNMESLVQEGRRALGAMIVVDSLEARVNGQYIKGRKVAVMAQNTVGDIKDSTQVPPVSAKIVADMLAMRSSDSLSLAAVGTDNHLVIKPVAVNGKNVPDISLESNSEKLFYISSMNRIALSDVSLGASARKGTPISSKVARRHSRTAFNPMDTLEVPDFMKEKDFRSADINFSLAKSMQKVLSVWNPSCQLKVGSGLLFFSAYPVNNRVRNLEFNITPSHAEIRNATVLSGSSDISVNSRLTGIRKMMTGKGRGMLNLDMEINSRRMDLNEILATIQASKTTKETVSISQTIENAEQMQDAFADTLSMSSIQDSASRGYPLIIVPANLNASMTVRGDSVKYAGFNFDGIKADLNMKERCIQLSDFKATSDMGSVSMDAFYSTTSKDSIKVGYNLSLSDITADKVIRLIPKVGEAVPVLNSFKGIVDFDLTLTSKVDTNMNVVVPTLNGVAEINGQNLVIEDLGPMKKVAKLLRFKDKETGHIDDMNIKAVIGDNRIEIFPFILGIDRYQLALTGSQHFPQNYIYHISVIKSPLPFKMGIKVFGNSYKAVSYHLEKPQFTSSVIPLFDDQVDTLQHNLIKSIKHIFDRGVNAAMEEVRLSRQSIARRMDEAEENRNILTAEEYEDLDLELIRSQAEEDDEALNQEIDDILKSL